MVWGAGTVSILTDAETPVPPSTYSQNKGHIQPFSEEVNTYIITHSLMQVRGSLSRNYFTSDPRNKQNMTVVQTIPK
jgi:ACT domain-containing protein